MLNIYLPPQIYPTLSHTYLKKLSKGNSAKSCLAEKIEKEIQNIGETVKAVQKSPCAEEKCLVCGAFLTEKEATENPEPICDNCYERGEVEDTSP